MESLSFLAIDISLIAPSPLFSSDIQAKNIRRKKKKRITKSMDRRRFQHA